MLNGKKILVKVHISGTFHLGVEECVECLNRNSFRENPEAGIILTKMKSID